MMGDVHGTLNESVALGFGEIFTLARYSEQNASHLFTLA